MSSPTLHRRARFSSALHAGRSADLGFISLYCALVTGFTVHGRPDRRMISDAKSYQLQMPLPVQW